MNARVTRRVFAVSSLLAPLLLSGCGGQTDVAQPPEISYERDTCVRCGMIISDERFAAALVAPDGSGRLFDDVGEMLLEAAEGDVEGQRAWAHDRQSAQWIDATAATFVRGTPETTPMGTGYVAFGKRDDAVAFAAQLGSSGEVLTWQEALLATQPTTAVLTADDQRGVH